MLSKEKSQKEKLYSPERRAIPGKESKGKALFTRKTNDTRKTVKRKGSIHLKREPHHENGQKEKLYSSK
ncbi:hypothetical protein AZF04_13205 [Alkalihalobacillus trypoxylicola]|uniref:Uncharacterized protein n=1 Tax=Alkalihalobacillus trypoxylicola TaxID=519424 RepID=A0A162CQN0_9BACI|nr:hypothetical protein AZF04_13205 [Alkalihalobacillus trypoxylicola]